MATVVVYEDEGQLTVMALEGAACLWQERVALATLAIWLKQAHDEKRLSRQDTLLRVLPETAVARRLVRLPDGARESQRRGMAASALTSALGERPAAWQLRSIGLLGLYAVSGLRQETVAQALKPFGRYAWRVRFIGAADWRLARCGELADGHYRVPDVLWSAVVTVREGSIIDGRAAGGSGDDLLRDLLDAQRDVPELGLPEYEAYLPSQEEGVPDGAALQQLALRGSVAAADWRQDRVLLGLLIGCVLLPGLLLLGLQLRPAEEVVESSAEVQQMVARSDYATLIAQAYAVKSDRITLLNHEASGDTLAITGRCSEALDLADYMNQLAAVSPSLHPLLLEMTRQQAEDRHYYDFVVQISWEGAAS